MVVHLKKGVKHLHTFNAWLMHPKPFMKTLLLQVKNMFKLGFD